MEGGPPGAPCRRRPQSTAVSCRSRAGVGSDCGKGPQSAGQVGDEKTNMCEPLLTHRNLLRRHRNRGGKQSPGQRRSEAASGARERPVCGPGGVRCKGGVSSSQALARNRRTCRLGCATSYMGDVGPVGRREGEPLRGESTDPRHRGGPARRSAGINRHGGGDGRALHRRSSDPRWPRVMRRRSARAAGEALTGARAGRAIEPRNHRVRGADAVYGSGRQHRQRRYRESPVGPARSENHGMYGTSMRENREIPCSPVRVITGRAAQGRPRPHA